MKILKECPSPQKSIVVAVFHFARYKPENWFLILGKIMTKRKKTSKTKVQNKIHFMRNLFFSEKNEILSRYFEERPYEPKNIKFLN